jgi:hypothetical protein
MEKSAKDNKEIYLRLRVDVKIDFLQDFSPCF